MIWLLTPKIVAQFDGGLLSSNAGVLVLCVSSTHVGGSAFLAQRQLSSFWSRFYGSRFYGSRFYGSRFLSDDSFVSRCCPGGWTRRDRPTTAP
jgi:hypothetical protein